MALYINKLEAIKRVEKGYATKNGVIEGQPYNIYKLNNIDISDARYKKLLNCVVVILNGMDDDAIEVYRKDLTIDGNKLRSIRKKQGRSGSWVAFKAGLSKTTVYNIEKGLKVARPSTIEKIAKVLHVPVEELS